MAPLESSNNQQLNKDNITPETFQERFTETPSPANSETPPPSSTHSPAPTREGALCKKLRDLGVLAAPHMVVVQEMCARHSDEHILAAAEIALEKNGTGIHVAYIGAMLKNEKKAELKKSDARKQSTIAPPNRQLIPPIPVGGSHHIKL